MKLTATQYGITTSIEVPDDDLNISQFHELCRRLAVSVEYHDECVRELFGAGTDLTLREAQ